MNDEPNMIQNGIITPDGTFLNSTHQHDFVSHEDRVTRELYFTDGGTESGYIRGTINNKPPKRCFVYDTTDHSEAREMLFIYPPGSSPTLLKDVYTTTLNKLLTKQEYYVKMIKQELLLREQPK